MFVSLLLALLASLTAFVAFAKDKPFGAARSKPAISAVACKLLHFAFSNLIAAVVLWIAAAHPALVCRAPDLTRTPSTLFIPVCLLQCYVGLVLRVYRDRSASECERVLGVALAAALLTLPIVLVATGSARAAAQDLSTAGASGLPLASVAPHTADQGQKSVPAMNAEPALAPGAVHAPSAPPSLTPAPADAIDAGASAPVYVAVRNAAPPPESS